MSKPQASEKLGEPRPRVSLERENYVAFFNSITQQLKETGKITYSHTYFAT